MGCRIPTAIFICLLARTAFAEPLLVKFETVGFENAREKTEKPKLIRSLEVVTEPGSVFFARTMVGKETLAIYGTLKLAKDGRFGLHLRNAHSKKQAGNPPRPHPWDRSRCSWESELSSAESNQLAGRRRSEAVVLDSERRHRDEL